MKMWMLRLPGKNGDGPSWLVYREGYSDFWTQKIEEATRFTAQEVDQHELRYLQGGIFPVELCQDESHAGHNDFQRLLPPRPVPGGITTEELIAECERKRDPDGLTKAEREAAMEFHRSYIGELPPPAHQPCVHESFQVVGDTARCSACHNLFTLFRPEPLDPAPPPSPASAGWTEDDTVRALTAAMREADEAFDRVGGSTRHHVRDCLLPVLEKRGIAVVPVTAPHFHKVRVKLPERADWIHESESAMQGVAERDRQWIAALRQAGVEIEGEQ